MAHVKTLRRPCRTCKREASNELFNQFNASLGVYCRKCTGPALRGQIKREKKMVDHSANMIRVFHGLQAKYD